ncbi:ABC transporter permease [Microbulbifer hydrolyticus]|uniref:ABC transport system permease protein n=1 Tax=Microbulbifer hydrolyticus TaxID=48074 RepID=A0A6P1TFA2_9GAMM|nr:FtsX-like permease family protein [Microbulbifer hydrolyticus]MBB5212268.1 putative ABC transport system permease protein [Microbulbifer hydrolyticus]QHQ39919.1 FtsX-like permease family protein [Microbulbifer hydrolyticus]
MFELKPMLSALWRNKVSALLIAIQLALTLAIVSNATVIVQDRLKNIARPTGMDVENIIAITFMPVPTDYDMAGAVRADLDMMRAMPGIVDATVTNQIPVSGSGSASSYYLEPNAQIGDVDGNYYQTDPHFINTLGLNLIEGRNFRQDEMGVYGSNERYESNVIVVTKQFADQAFPEGNALGKFLYHGSDDKPMEIIGIVERHLGAWPSWSLAGNVVFHPLLIEENHKRYLVRTEPGQRDAIFKQLEDKLADRDPQRVIHLETLSENLASTYVADNIMVKVLATVMALLTFIVALGIVGLTIFWINQRAKQIGVRRALGATRANIGRYFLVENSMIAGTGLILGTAAALIINQLMVSEFSQPALSLPMLAVCALILLLVSIVAALMPAMRAANISPAMATRSI